MTAFHFIYRGDLEQNPGPRELAQLTDRASGSVIVDEVLESALASADAVIWPALHGYDRAAVQAEPDPILKEIARPLVIAALYFGREKPESVAKDEATARGLLDRIARADYVLALGNPPAMADTGSVLTEVPEAVFDAASMAGY
jgi:hypothetical protein